MSAEVLIIESRSFDDIHNDRHEGKTLKEVLRMQGIKSHYYEVATKEQLIKSLKRADRKSVKYVHISAHGEKGGFELTDGSFVTWADFDEVGWPYLKDTCLVFSSCDVAKGIEVIFSFHKTFCSAIVAPVREIYWHEGIVAYSAFYHRATKPDSSPEYDVKVMNTITEAGTFKYISSSSGAPTYVLGKG